MKPNPILKEIRATRDKLAEAAGGDMPRLFGIVRERAKATRARQEVVVPEPNPRATVREEAAGYEAASQRREELDTNPIIAEIRQAREAIMAEVGGDSGRLFAMARKREAAAKARGVKLVPVPKRGKRNGEAAP